VALPLRYAGISRQQQCVATARALVNNPVMLPADEPTGNLDSRAGMEIMQMFQALNRLRQGPNMLVIHDLRITACCQRRLSLHDGKIVSDGIMG
jgi:putative ABC transport system ATP-binding protein